MPEEASNAVSQQGIRLRTMCAGLFSIEIFAMCPGGGWRTLSEWKAMFAKHGYQLEDTKLVGANMSCMVWGRGQ